MYKFTLYVFQEDIEKNLGDCKENVFTLNPHIIKIFKYHDKRYFYKKEKNNRYNNNVDDVNNNSNGTLDDYYYINDPIGINNGHLHKNKKTKSDI